MQSETLTLRCPDELVTKLDDAARRLSRPGLPPVSRAAVARAALAVGLPRVVAENDGGTGGPEAA